MKTFNPYYSAAYKGRRGYHRSKYFPHQGKNECARRVRQAERIAAKNAAK